MCFEPQCQLLAMQGCAVAAGRQVDMAAFPEGYSLRGPSTTHPPKTWCLKMKDYKPSLAGGRPWGAVVPARLLFRYCCWCCWRKTLTEGSLRARLLPAAHAAELCGPLACGCRRDGAAVLAGRWAVVAGAGDLSQRRRRGPQGLALLRDRCAALFPSRGDRGAERAAEFQRAVLCRMPLLLAWAAGAPGTGCLLTEYGCSPCVSR